MNVFLFRKGNRALIVPANKDLIDCPPAVRHWLGPPESNVQGELTEHMAMLGLQATQLLTQLTQYGFCALDLDGIVEFFPAAPSGAAAPARALDDMLRNHSVPEPGT
ncbi:hypothetical protein [Cupriavidus pauculus]|uniref:YcgL domain-containing protein n=1 Tax=Cupriavidus pauculus TaxID=82633 RepID=A0A2N5CB41_9BURK|nr:hypothetical protein [Cupriavidus pauculus]PLP99438.1 hypothetical protein CYJ10_16555 [Cupriavidus pauculus]